MSRRKKYRNESAKLNNITYITYFNRIKKIALSRFKWHNLPKTIDERFLELILFENGMSVFFKDDVIGYLALKTYAGGRLSNYNIPINRTAIADNDYRQELNIDDSVIIYNNYLRTPDVLECELFAHRLTNMQRTIDVNINAQKTPLIVLATENQRLTLENLFLQYDGNQHMIFGDKTLDVNAMKVLETKAEFVADKIQTLKKQTWSEVLTWLGIESVTTEKRERLVGMEVSAGMGGTNAEKSVALSARKQACEEINEMFGLDIDVSYSDEFKEIQSSFLDKGGVAIE